MSVFSKLVTLHRTPAAANIAKENLVNAGVRPADITVDDASTLGAMAGNPAVYKRIYGPDIEEYEAKTYATAVPAGAAVLTVRADADQAPGWVGLANQQDVVDVKAQAVASKVITEKAAATVALPTLEPVKVVDRVLEKPDVLRLAEEHVAVGKKVVETGTTRVRRYVVTTPVSEAVTLHDEHVEVVKKALDDPNVNDVDWGEATIEMRETAETPYVVKSAKVVAEVDLKKVAEDHKEVVADAVRREDYKVEKVAEDVLLSDKIIDPDLTCKKA